MRIFLVDADNFSAPSWVDEALVRLEASEGTFAVRRAYGSVEYLKGLSDGLKRWAIRPFANLVLSKNTTDVALAVDAMELACHLPKPSVIAICAGDADYAPLAVRLRERGIKVVCVTVRNKMAQDAVPAYDQVIYVGSEQVEPPQVPDIKPPSPPPVRVATKSVAVKASAVKTAKPKSVTATKSVANKVPAKKTVGTTTEAVTVARILSAVPNLKTVQWQPLGDVAKLLHDKKLLAKSTSSTKLFKKFPHHFELTPAGKPNQVRFIL